MAYAALDRAPTRRKTYQPFAAMRRVLDILYLWSAYLAAASMVMVLLITLAQILTAMTALP